MNLLLTLLFLSTFPATISGIYCRNGGTETDGYCHCAPGYSGYTCQNINCVHGSRRREGSSKCECNEGFAGKFCNLTAESICKHGTILWDDYCSCDSGWEGDKCDKIYCTSVFSERASDTECKCTYRGVYPNCDYKSMTGTIVMYTVLPILFSSLIIFIPVCIICYRRRRNQENARRFTAQNQQFAGQTVVIAPPPVAGSSYPPAATQPMIAPPPIPNYIQAPPSYGQAVGKQY